MKSIIRTMTAIILTTLTCTASYGKTTAMTTDRYHLLFNKIDYSIVGTWEMNGVNQPGQQPVFCQFNANGTFISFTCTQGVYHITGRGKWQTKDRVIYIIHGEEKSVPILYEAEENRLVFGNQVTYTKHNPVYASR
ncbi:MAG: hypothetical protein U0T77_00615 [Chitinophagales bacterium]